MAGTLCPNCGRAAIAKTPKRYHYLESGLPNVWLLGGVTETVCKECGQTTVRVEKEPQLLQVITMDLLMKRAPLTGPEMRFIRSACEMSQEDLARELKMTRRPTIAEWERKNHTARGFIEELGLRLVLLKMFGGYLERPGCSFLAVHHLRQLDKFAEVLVREAIEFADGMSERITAHLGMDGEQWEIPESKAA